MGNKAGIGLLFLVRLSVVLGAAVLVPDSGRTQENPQRLDSILPLLDPAIRDTNQLAMLIMAAESWTTSTNAIPYLLRLDSLSDHLLRDPSAAVRARARHARGAYLFFIGYRAKFERNIPLALSSLERAITYFAQDDHLNAIGECHDAMGLVLQVAGDPEEAQRHFQQELRIGRRLGRTRLVNQALVHLARIAGDRGDRIAASAYLDSCGASAPGDSALVLVERARLLEMMGSHEAEEGSLRQALEVAARSDNPWDRLPALTPLIRLLYAQQRTNEGKKLAQECIDLAERMGDRVAACTCMMLLGDGALLEQDAKTAERNWLAGLELARQNGTLGVARELGDEGSMLGAASRLKDLYVAQGRNADALRYTQLWAELTDSVYKMDGRAEVVLLRYREQRSLDSLGHVQSLLHARLEHQAELGRERLRRYVIIGAGGAALLALLALWNRARYREQVHRRIISAQERLLESERQRENEQVRTRIARDIHDDIGSGLTKIAMLSNEAKRRADQHADGLHETLERITVHSREVSASLSDIIWSVDPEHDTSAELIHQAGHVAHRLLDDDDGKRHSLTFEHRGPEHPVSPSTKHHIVKVMKEAINNALKHAGARRIDVHLDAGDGRFSLLVQDDGNGFDPLTGTRSGNGLRNMQDRARALGAALEVTSTPGQGCSIKLEGPLV
ncbi:MAG TPA: histidine kinase [Flavobacteriales bacterium]|nr:histidine kinase [Flavobacteriales bacterium]